MTEREWLTSEDPQAMLGFLGTCDRLPGPPPISDRKARLFACACCRQVWQPLGDERSRCAVEVAERYADGEATYDEMRQAAEDADSLPHRLGLPDEPQRLFSVPPAVMAALLRDIAGNPWRPVWWADDPKKHARPRATFGGPSDDGAKDHPARVEMRRVWLTPTVLGLARAAYDDRLDNAGAIAEAEKGIETLNFIMSRCYSDSAYRGYQANLHEHHKRLESLRKAPVGTLDPARLAVLADALEEAGCDSEPLLMHLRGERPCIKCLGTGKGGDNYLDRAGGGIITCASCRNTGRVELRGPHVRGCWVLDILLGNS